MDLQIIVNCSLILMGAMIMAVSIVKSKALMSAMPLVPEEHRGQVKAGLHLDRGLMCLFLVGYLAVFTAFMLGWPLVSELVVSIIFLLGAVFVFSSLSIQARLLAEVQKTLQEILPICCRCKSIRTENSDGQDPNSWQTIEAYISDKGGVDLSHGYCPHCLAEELKKIDTTSA